ncbi:hypothetical protein ZIOFF_053355 [Zingiber officinale]|uniref:Tubulin-specific chaperone A n=1 Tax=Zingiber officinale TaxID=94328 RepID=A0A8J5FDC2_ZINOF|nr:hypothetical protein ZIOFF_053355 [Zingiber officinale]
MADPVAFLQISMATVRSLKIKTATCKRILKELRSYEKEVEKEAAKTADMKEKGADPYDLKQQAICFHFSLCFSLLYSTTLTLCFTLFFSMVLVIQEQRENVLAESRMMIPDCHKRLEASLSDLKGILAELKEQNLQGAEIDEGDSTVVEVEAFFRVADE